MTLAVLHDSGWYNVDFSKASPDFNWGKGLGCDFVKKSCLQFSTLARNIKPYCNSQTKLSSPRQIYLKVLNIGIILFIVRQLRAANATCRVGRTEFCNLIRYNSELPRQYRNIEDSEDGAPSHWGGGMWLADFCPTIVTMESSC